MDSYNTTYAQPGQETPHAAYSTPGIAISPSYFDGGLLGLIGLNLLVWLLSLITLGLAYPWVICIKLSWKMRHTVIGGRRLRFTGTGIGLFGNWIKWFLLTIITLGIYGFWMHIKVIQWETKHTVFA